MIKNKSMMNSVSDPHWLYADPDTDPDPAFLTNADPDTNPDPVRIRILVKFEQGFPKVNKTTFFSSNFSQTQQF
jgi:hypothetical protein